MRSNNNNITENNFINNTVKHIEIVMSSNNKFYKNYWDNWIGLKIPFLKEFPKFIPVIFTYKRIFAKLPLDVRRIPIGFNLDKNPASINTFALSIIFYESSFYKSLYYMNIIQRPFDHWGSC